MKVVRVSCYCTEMNPEDLEDARRNMVEWTTFSSAIRSNNINEIIDILKHIAGTRVQVEMARASLTRLFSGINIVDIRAFVTPEIDPPYPIDQEWVLYIMIVYWDDVEYKCCGNVFELQDRDFK
jgi:hypothetical protein